MQQWQGTVLVTGAAGNLGRRIIKNLVARDIPALALVRNPEQIAPMEALGTEAVQGDLKEPASLQDAVVGVRGIISAAGVGFARGGDTPQTVDFQGNANLINLAVQANVRHFVLISVIGAQNLRQSTVFQAKYHTEQYLRQTGIPFTVLRAGGFMSDYSIAWERGAKQGRYDVVGDPNKPLGLISPDDLAELAVRSLWEPGARAKTLQVTSDEILTPAHIAAIHSRVFQRPIRLRRLPVTALRAARIAVRPFATNLADFLGFLQAVGEEQFEGKPDEILRLYPNFGFERYEDFLQRTRPA